MKRIKRKSSLREAMTYPFLVILLLVSALAAMLAFPTLNINSPEGLGVTATFFFIALEGCRVADKPNRTYRDRSLSKRAGN